jgi:hypothetical protein
MHGTATIDNRDGHVIEGLRAPGADIEDAATVRVIRNHRLTATTSSTLTKSRWCMPGP